MVERNIKSRNGSTIYFKISGTKPTAIVFVHGWLGNSNWWNRQRDYFKNRDTVVQVDLPGHGKSEKGRAGWSSSQYADDIKEVINQIPSENVVLVGHSMSGAYALKASLTTPNVKLVVLVDTLKNMNQLMTYKQADDLILKFYRNDFKYAVENLLPKFLFAETTPAPIRQRLTKEFLKSNVELAVNSIEPLYKMNIPNLLKRVRVPVRAINSNLTPTHIDSIRKYNKDFEYVTISGSGHYPMLEQPRQFNRLLNGILNKVRKQ